MSLSNQHVKEKATPKHLYGSAPLKNLRVLDALATSVIERADHLPGIVTFSGPSGFGKSMAAAYIAAKHQSYYIEVRSTWNVKAFLLEMLQTMGIKPARTISDMANQVAEELATSQKPTIIDEFDNAVEQQKIVELVRDLYEQSKAPFILVGEENLPQKLQRWERFHGRIMDWGQAQPADLDDARILNKHYAGDIHVEDDLLQVLATEARGSVRRIVTNLERIANFARAEQLERISQAHWGNRQLHTATPPLARKKF